MAEITIPVGTHAVIEAAAWRIAASWRESLGVKTFAREAEIAEALIPLLTASVESEFSRVAGIAESGRLLPSRNSGRILPGGDE